MSSRERVEVRPGAYHDSVTLLQVSRAVAGVEGVSAAQVAMATDLNVESNVLMPVVFSILPQRHAQRGRRKRLLSQVDHGTQVSTNPLLDSEGLNLVVRLTHALGH